MNEHTPAPDRARNGSGIMFNPGCIVRTTRMTLRNLESGDRDEFVRVHNVSQELFEPWMPRAPEGETLELRFERMLERAATGSRQDSEYRLVGILVDGRIAGFFNLFQIVRGAFENGSASWSVSADVAGQGLATEGVAGLLDFAFAPRPAGLGLHRVGAAVIPENLASVRVAEKNGFRREGLGRKYLRIAGQWQDHILYAKLAEEHAAVSAVAKTSGR